MKKVWVRSVIAFSLLLLLYASTIGAAGAVNAVVVSDVKGLRDYVPGSHSFTHGDTLKVYVEMQDVNHYGFVSVDFFFIIEDPKGHVVATDSTHVEHRNYRDSDIYVEYAKEIPDWWLDGKYKLGIYAYDRVDDIKTREAVRKIESNRSSVEELIEHEEFELGDVVTKSLADSSKEKRDIVFFVLPGAIEEIERVGVVIPGPSKPEEVARPIFTVTSVGIDKFKVKPGEPVSISVTVKNMGIEGTEKVTVVLNGEEEAEESVTLAHMESKTLIFHVKKDVPGTYKVTIPGSDIVRLFFVEEGKSQGATNSTLSTSKVSAAVEASSPVVIPPIPPVAIIISIAVAIAIILLRFRFLG